MSIFAPHPNPTLRVLSLGLGVQSTTMLFMAAAGEIGPMPDVAYFADTQAEPQAVMAHLSRLRGLNSLPFPIEVLTRGSLRDAVITSANTTGGRFAAVPFFTRQENGDIGRGRRQCTHEYKLTPIWAAIRARLGVAKGKRVPKGVTVETWVGITTNEVMRASASRHGWEHLRYPLIEAGMSRGDCIEWLMRADEPVPPRSRCEFCPFTSNAEWRHIKRFDRPQWDRSTALDRAIRAGGKQVSGEQFVHRSCVPLETADLNEPDPRQLIMGDVCGGACGT